MSNIGRLITEKEWPFALDLNSLFFSMAGTGFIIETGKEEDEECTPSLSTESDLRMNVGAGYAAAPIGEIEYFPGNEASFRENKEDVPRLDIIYLEKVEDGLKLVKKEGEPAERPKAPQLPHPDDAITVPIAVVGFKARTDRITDIFDARTVISSEHSHGAGEGLELVESKAMMNVKADEESVTVEDGMVELTDEAIDPETLQVEWGKGLEVLDTTGDGEDDTARVDDGHGLGFDEEEKLTVKSEDLAGDGLRASDNELEISSGDGLITYDESVTLDLGNGLMIDDENFQLSVSLSGGSGLRLDDYDRIYVYPLDIAGAGLIGDEDSINVNTGEGTTIKADRIEVEAEKGLRTYDPDGQGAGEHVLETYIDPYGGLSYDEDGKLYADIPDIAGKALEDVRGRVNVKAGNGLKIEDDQVTIDAGRGIRISGGKIQLDHDGEDALKFVSDKMELEPAALSGEGLKIEDENLKMELGDGLYMYTGKSSVPEGFGLEMGGGYNESIVKVDVEKIVGDGLELYEEDGETMIGANLMDYFEKVLEIDREIEAGKRHNLGIPYEHRGKDLIVMKKPTSRNYNEEDRQVLKHTFVQPFGDGTEYYGTLPIINEGPVDSDNEDQSMEYELMVLTPKWTDTVEVE